jgi:hypothetical protein
LNLNSRSLVHLRPHPEDLPPLLRYRAGQLVQAAMIEEMSAEQLKLREVVKPDIKPSLWASFSAKNWASS